jgi:hypothetical protein
MHQDIHTFSQIMDIDIKNKLSVSYELKIHRTISYKFYINDRAINDTKGQVYFDSNELLNFSIKNISDGGAIEIIKICIDDTEILPKYLKNAVPQTNWIENIDSWCFKLSKPFYSYIQEITGQGEIF